MHEFAVWAPKPDTVRLDVDGTAHPMARDADGWWRATVEAAPNARYGYLLDDDPKPLPDPRSARQPDGVHDRSQLWQPTTRGMDGRRMARSLISGRGDLRAALRHVHVGGHLRCRDRQAGLSGRARRRLRRSDAGELVFGHPRVGRRRRAVVRGARTLRRTRRAGPIRRRLPWPRPGSVDRHGVQSLARRATTCPGSRLTCRRPATRGAKASTIADAGSDEVRRYIIDCALRWMRDFHADGLRLDAVHALFDTTAIHLLEELSAETDTLAEQLGRPLSLVAESDLNDPRMITPRADHGLGMAAQWDDDIHHAIHTAVSGERQGYYADFGSLATLAKTLREGFFHAATYSSFRQRRHGRPLDTATIPATRLLAYTCTHDQVGNSALGDRPSQNLSYGQLAVKAALVLCSPYTPMLFMGEEWAALTPFQFFSSHPEPELARATAEGRRKEFADHGWDAEEIPDPQDPQTFQRSKLDWSELDVDEHAKLLRLYQDLIALRRNETDLADPWLQRLFVDYDEDARWIAMRRGRLTVACNLGAQPVRVPFAGELVLRSDPPDVGDENTALAPHSFVILRAVDN